jgi:CheY-like chemotaxis protein
MAKVLIIDDDAGTRASLSGLLRLAGLAHGALIATFPGDTTMATAEQVRAFARGGSARIQR